MSKTYLKDKIVKLIHDKYENDFGFMEGSNVENVDEIKERMSELRCEYIPKEIYTWAIKIDTYLPIDDMLVFDVSLFFTKIKDRSRLSSLTGNDEEIQDSIICHPRFLELLEKVITTVEEEKAYQIGFICNYGKHRSVGWANIMKKYFYKDATVKHYTLDKPIKKS